MERYWSRFSDDFDIKQAYAAGEEVIAAVSGKLSEQQDLGKVLELGCGNGRYTRCILAATEIIIATDYSLEMVEKTRMLFSSDSRVRVEQVDCHKVPFAESTFNTVLMANLIHIIDKPEIAVREARRVLVPGGQLILTSFTTEEMTLINKVGLLRRYLLTFGPFPKKRTMFSTKTICQLLQEEGFSVEESVLLGRKTKSLFVKALK